MAIRNIKKSPYDSHEPKAVGVILDEMLRSDSRFATAYRRYKEATDTEAEVETDRLFKDLHPDTHLDVDLKLITCEPGRMSVGAYLDGMITRDGEYHFTFLQNSPEKKRVVVRQRNPHVYIGRRINVNRKDDGTLYPTFNRPKFTRSFTFRDFCQEAAEELMAVAGLVENNQPQGM